MATYNWRFRPGNSDIYGISQEIENTADDIKPSNACYVSLFGNDVTGNGSRMKPLKTLQAVRKRGFNGTYTILGSGVYRGYLGGDGEGTFINCGNFVGDGDVILDVSGIDGSQVGGFLWGDTRYFNLTIRGNDSIKGGGVIYQCPDCTWDKISWNEGYDLSARVVNASGAILKNILTAPVGISVGYASPKEKLTVYNCANVGIVYDSSTNIAPIKNNIFVKCNVTIYAANPKEFDRNIFHQCNFRFGNQSGNPYEAIYPDVPSGFQYIDNIDDFRAAFLAVYPQLLTPFQNTKFVDPKFNNPEIGDFSLSFDSPAKNLSYFGTFIGAQSIGYPVKASTTEANGSFDFSTAVNINIADNSIKMADSSLLASIETKVITNLIQRELGKAPIYGFNADRNGQYIDSIADLATATISPGTNLAVNTPYIVEVAAIVNDGNTIQPGERFTTSSVVSFTSAGGGVCREIIEAPQRHTILARFFDGGNTIAMGTALVVGYWYYVAGLITYNGVDYTDTIFKAVDTNSFTGSGIVMEAMTNQSWQHYEPGIKFSSNNVGDSRTGAIVRGNGDPLYERGTGKEFAINARFIQVKYIIQPNNLKP